jgi:glucose-6-phosphate dehydrogenase assembly protein OpcA
MQLGVTVEYDLTSGPLANGVHGVQLTRASGVISLEREIPDVATLNQPGQPVQDLTLKRRSLRDCLADELRRLDPDELYGEIIMRGLPALNQKVTAEAGDK